MAEPILTAHLFPKLEQLLIELLSALEPADWQVQTVAPKWNVKDVAAHLLDTQLRKLALLRDNLAAERPGIGSDADLFAYINRLNEEGVAYFRRLSPALLISLMKDASEQSIAFHQALEPFAPAAFPVSWAGERQSLNWFDTAREYPERWHHQQQIRLAVNRPGIETAELYHPVLDCFMRALPHSYRDVSAPIGMSLLFDIEGPAGGTWFLERGDSWWALSSKATASPVAGASIPQEIACGFSPKVYFLPPLPRRFDSAATQKWCDGSCKPSPSLGKAAKWHLREMKTIREEAAQILAELGVPHAAYDGGTLEARTPITGEVIGRVHNSTVAEADQAIERADAAFRAWRNVPAPKRGELVRLLGEELREAKTALGRLVTIEAGKIVSEGLGEVQEMIDICTFAAGLSRQLCGLTIATERPLHRMMETWHPLGVTGIISAFNFPVAVWAWNAALALVCGNPVVWKPSEKTPLTALATQALFERAVAKFGSAPEGLSTVLNGGKEIGEALAGNRLVPLVSATGSTAMGKQVGPKLAARFARAILELGGNNAAIVCESADLDLALRGIAFAAMGTAGQRCTTLRRLLVHDSIYDSLLPRLKQVYGSVAVGDPREQGTLVGPLIDGRAFDGMQHSLAEAKAAGGAVTGGERASVAGCGGGFYVRPALVEMKQQTAGMKRETFAPLLYALRFSDLDEALRLHNDVPQGLASAIFTNDLREAERFVSVEGSDCGIANVNIGPSGAEIGGAFGGEKETGGGRESGSDVWKLYMRRATNTINYGRELPLAQGVKFDVG